MIAAILAQKPSEGAAAAKPTGTARGEAVAGSGEGFGAVLDAVGAPAGDDTVTVATVGVATVEVPAPGPPVSRDFQKAILSAEAPTARAPTAFEGGGLAGAALNGGAAAAPGFPIETPGAGGATDPQVLPGVGEDGVRQPASPQADVKEAGAARGLADTAQAPVPPAAEDIVPRGEAGRDAPVALVPPQAALAPRQAELGVPQPATANALAASQAPAPRRPEVPGAPGAPVPDGLPRMAGADTALPPPRPAAPFAAPAPLPDPITIADSGAVRAGVAGPEPTAPRPLAVPSALPPESPPPGSAVPVPSAQGTPVPGEATALSLPRGPAPAPVSDAPPPGSDVRAAVAAPQLATPPIPSAAPVPLTPVGQAVAPTADAPEIAALPTAPAADRSSPPEAALAPAQPQSTPAQGGARALAPDPEAPPTDSRAARAGPDLPQAQNSAPAQGLLPQQSAPYLPPAALGAPPAFAPAPEALAKPAALALDGMATELIAGTAATRTEAASPPLPGPAAPASPELARSVAAQIAEGLRQSAPGVFEITLVPEELGRLRIAVTAADAGMTVAIAAERPETLEFIRRHVDLLLAEARDGGLGNLNLSFSGGGASEQARVPAFEDPALPDSTPPLADKSVPRRAAQDGLDLRL